ncbi:hypothetical protein AB6A40_001744 [Gnathostoma spinigerum]|uniref:Extended synaptotagmin-2 n=1 Tax=Gnathostoma spinigerum TaxID=75299 RepID=A0ABD6E4W4_9BILA
MAWQSYAVPFCGSLVLMGSCYYLGRNEYSFFWILLLVFFNILKSWMWKKRERRLLALRETATREREVIMTQLQDLPAWVRFPDTERVEWINKVVHQLWPYIGEFASRFTREYVEPQMRTQLPAIFKSFKFEKIDIGDIPCRVGGVKVYTHNVGRDRIIVDMDVAYAGDSNFTVSVAGFRGGMNQLQFSGKMRVVLKPLLPYPPMVGGISGSFLETPKIDFNLTGMGEMVELPGLMNAIRSVMNAQVSNICVLPNEIVVPLAPQVDVTKLYFPEPDGVVRFKIVEASNLENMDISFIRKGKSDPYCEIQVGSQFFRTKTIDNNLNPVWNEHFEAVVDQADGQKLRIEVFDEDPTGSDELGRLTLDFNYLRDEGVLDKWYPLEGCRHGDLHIKASWLNLSTSLRDLERQDWESDWLRSEKPIHAALLMLFIDNISDLPYPKAKLEPSPFVQVSLGSETQRTPVKVKTVNPLFQSRFTFFIRHPEGQELKIDAIDDGTRRSLGDFTLPLTSVIKEPDMQICQQTFPLSLGVHQSPIVMTIKIRSFTESKIRESSPSAAAHPGHSDHTYANAVHIERAEKVPNESSNLEVNAMSDSMAVEPGKTVSSGGTLTPEIKLNVKNINMLRRGSGVSTASSQSRKSNFRLAEKLFGSKHCKLKNAGSQPSGLLQLSIRYAQPTRKLILVIVKAKGLRAIDKAGTADPYVIAKLISKDGSQSAQKRKTSVIKQSLDPVFNNHFEFDVHSSEIQHYLLRILVKDATNYGMFSRTPVLGQIGMDLENMNCSQEIIDHWVNLEPPD